MWCCQPRSRLSFFWSVTPQQKTVAEIEAEKWVLVVPYAPRQYCLPLCTLPFRRWMLLVASILVQVCNGSLYAWSILNHHIDEHIQDKPKASVPPAKEMAVVTFYIAVGAHGFAAALFGPFVERHGPRHSLIIAVCLHIVGHIASFVSLYYKSYIGLYIGYGVFCGAGFGIGYIAPVSAVLKWFPDLRGTAGGFAICGVGLGATLWASIYDPLVRAVGIDRFFLVHGCIVCFVLLLSAFVLRTPPPNYVVGGRNAHGIKVIDHPKQSLTSQIGQSIDSAERVSAVLGDEQRDNYVSVFDYREQELGEAEILYHNKIKNLRIRECAFSVDFALLYLVFIGGCLPGTVILSRVYDIGNNVYLHQNEEVLTHLVMYMSISNFLGHVLCPLISDGFIRVAQLNPAFGRKILIGVLMVNQIVVLILLKSFVRGTNMFVPFEIALCFLIFSYGGVFGVIPSLLTEMYGLYNSGTMHGIILTATSICAIGGGLIFQTYFLSIISKFPTEKIVDGVIAAYEFNLHWLLVVACVGCALVPLVRTNPVDRFFPGYQYSLFGCPLIRITKRDY
ncbi:hypothetical protein AC1031_008704 [Aphanomyces cochlioides]|nr:hypothetical protein AC1031_008704 [Aphanomyces cochlioides]